MITPADIQNAEFAKSVKGYSQEQVDKFLDDLTLDYEGVLKENERMKEEIELLNQRLDEYKAQEGAVIRTLETAKSLMNDISASAEKRADILLKNAMLDAEFQTKQASENVKGLRLEEEKLQRRVAGIKTRLKSILESELERIDNLAEDIFGEAVKDPEPSFPAAEMKTEEADIEDEDLFKTRAVVRGE